MLERISREQYYRETEKVLKACSQLPMEMQVQPKPGDEWESLNLYEDPLTDDASYRLEVSINFRPLIIPENRFDKVFNGFVKYNNKSEVNYTDQDVKITVNNLRYAIMHLFAEEFLQPGNFK